MQTDQVIIATHQARPVCGHCSVYECIVRRDAVKSLRTVRRDAVKSLRIVGIGYANIRASQAIRFFTEQLKVPDDFGN